MNTYCTNATPNRQFTEQRYHCLPHTCGRRVCIMPSCLTADHSHLRTSSLGTVLLLVAPSGLEPVPIGRAGPLERLRGRWQGAVPGQADSCWRLHLRPHAGRRHGGGGLGDGRRSGRRRWRPRGGGAVGGSPAQSSSQGDFNLGTPLGLAFSVRWQFFSIAPHYITPVLRTNSCLRCGRSGRGDRGDGRAGHGRVRSHRGRGDGRRGRRRNRRRSGRCRRRGSSPGGAGHDDTVLLLHLQRKDD